MLSGVGNWNQSVLRLPSPSLRAHPWWFCASWLLPQKERERTLSVSLIGHRVFGTRTSCGSITHPSCLLYRLCCQLACFPVQRLCKYANILCLSLWSCMLFIYLCLAALQDTCMLPVKLLVAFPCYKKTGYCSSILVCIWLSSRQANTKCGFGYSCKGAVLGVGYTIALWSMLPTRGFQLHVILASVVVFGWLNSSKRIQGQLAASTAAL